MLGACNAVRQGFIALEISLRRLFRNFGLKVWSISRGSFEQRIRELKLGNSKPKAATESMRQARLSRREQLTGLKRRVRKLTEADPPCRRMISMHVVDAVVVTTSVPRSTTPFASRLRSSLGIGSD